MKPLTEACNILETIGNTPMLKFSSITKNYRGHYFAKAEFYNPGNSVKDRIAKYIIEAAEREGTLKLGMTIIETTSGNTGFSLAMIAVTKGYKCVVAISNKSSVDKIDLLSMLGAKVYVCPANVPVDDPRSYYETAKRLHRDIPNSIYINQYFNSLNIDAHYYSTGPEIWKQTEGKITHLVACSGTGGTISGTGRYLKKKNPDVKIIGVDAYGSVLKKYHETGELDENEIYPYLIEGLGKNLIPLSTDFNVIDYFEKVTDKASALMTRRIFKEEGMFVGYTSGAVLQAIDQLNAKKYFTKESVVVVVLPDHGSRYINKVFSNEWMVSKKFLNTEELNKSVEIIT